MIKGSKGLVSIVLALLIFGRMEVMGDRIADSFSPATFAYVDPTLESTAIDIDDEMLNGLLDGSIEDEVFLKRIKSIVDGFSYISIQSSTDRENAVIWGKAIASWINVCKGSSIPYQVSIFNEEEGRWISIRYHENLFSGNLHGGCVLTVDQWNEFRFENFLGELVVFKGLENFLDYLKMTVKPNSSFSVKVIISSRALAEDGALSALSKLIDCLNRFDNKDVGKVFYQLWLPSEENHENGAGR